MEEKKKNVAKTTEKGSKKIGSKKTRGKKEEPKKVVVKEEKVEKELPTLTEEEPFGVRFKRFISSYSFLYSAFAILFVLVIILAIMVFTKSKEAVEENSNIVFSIIEKDTRNTLNLDLESLVGKEYSLKVTNYRSNKVSEEEIPYSIHVTNNTDVEIEITKDKEKDNLMENQKETTIKGEALTSGEKEEVIYYFKVKNSDHIKSGDAIQIEVIS